MVSTLSEAGHGQGPRATTYSHQGFFGSGKIGDIRQPGSRDRIGLVARQSRQGASGSSRSAGCHHRRRRRWRIPRPFFTPPSRIANNIHERRMRTEGTEDLTTLPNIVCLEIASVEVVVSQISSYSAGRGTQALRRRSVSLGDCFIESTTVRQKRTTLTARKLGGKDETPRVRITGDAPSVWKHVRRNED